MALVMIARYADLGEAQVAAAMLRANGMLAIIPEEQMGSTNFLLSQAMGGYRLCVAETDTEAAVGLIAPHRAGSPEALDWRSHPDAAATAVSSVFWAIADPTGGFAWARLRKRFTVTALLGLLLALLSIATTVALVYKAGL